MRKSLLLLLLVGFFGIPCCGGLVYIVFWRDSPDFANYKRIQVGMSVEEVQAILAPGTPVKQSEVPGTEVFVNPADEKAAAEKFRKLGPRATTKIRDYPMRTKPIVEGDLILKWENNQTGARVLVSFKDGKVHEKDFWEPSL